jgi:membrane protein implicated in regulation of membrane protease activity
MLIHRSAMALQIMAAGAILIVAMAWLLAVPAVLTPVTFMALAALLFALGWVAWTTYQNAQSADAVGQLLYETENQVPTRRPGGRA